MSRPQTADLPPDREGETLATHSSAGDDQVHIALMFRTIALSTALIVTAILPLLVVAQPDAFWRALFVIGVVDGLVLITIWLSGRGSLRVASWLYFAVILALLTFNARSAGGIRSPGVQAYFVFVMLAGLLLGHRVGVLVAIASALLGLGLAVSEMRGWLPAQTVVYNPIALWLLNCIYIGVALLTMRLGLRAVEDALGRAQRELRERRGAQRRLDQALEAGAIATFDYDLRTGEFRGDRRALAIAGLAPRRNGAVVHDDFERLVHADDRQRLAAELRQFTDGRHHGRTSYRIVRPGGDERAVDAAAFITRDDTGQPASIVGMLLDVTERAHAEREQARLVLNLGERVKELRLLHAVAQLLHQRRPIDSLIAELVAILPGAWLHAEDCRARVAYQDTEAASPGWCASPWKQGASFETSAGRGVVEVAYLVEHAPADDGPFLAEEGALLTSIAEMLRSHIEERVVEQQRLGLERQLRQSQKMEALGTLAGGIAHDFNNILTAIGGNAELALWSPTLDDSARGSLSEILKAHARASDLVQRILLFSRRQESAREVRDLTPLVYEALQLLRASLPASTHIRTTVATHVPPVLADATQIHQIIMNLGTNAGYAMSETGGTLSVEVDVVTVGDVATAPSADLAAGPHVRISVTDTGTGMSQAVRDRLFEPFFTTKGQAGTGLGLSVVHGIVREHDGAITVDSEIGRGTVFTIYLTSAVAPPNPATPDRRQIVRGSGQHVMYIDDEAAIVLLMSRTLERLGYRCTAFTDPDMALQAFRTNPHRFDAVVTDMQMPKLSGVDLARALREARPDVPIAIASGYTATDKDDTSVRWIQKPLPLADLSGVLRDLLGSPAAGESEAPCDQRTGR